VPDEREALVPLFIELSHRRALLHVPSSQILSLEYIRTTVREMRKLLVQARMGLKGGGDAAEWVDSMTKACLDYLDAGERAAHADDVEPNLVPALRELREFFRGAAVHFANEWDLFEARNLVREMYREDLRRLEEEIQRAGVDVKTP
jgi:hypothetical protein